MSSNSRGRQGSADAPRSSKRPTVSMAVLTKFYGLPHDSEFVVAETMNEGKVNIAPAVLVSKKNFFLDLHTGQRMPSNNMDNFFDTRVIKEGDNVVFAAVDMNARAHISKRHLINRFGSDIIR